MPGGALGGSCHVYQRFIECRKLMLGVVEKMARGGRAVTPTPAAVVNRFDTRGLVQDECFFTEEELIASMAVVNVTRADPGFAHESLVNSRGAAGVAEEERVAAEDEGGAQEGGDDQVAPEEAAGPAFAPLTLANVHDESTSARALSGGIY
jgi:hypothetical protein